VFCRALPLLDSKSIYHNNSFKKSFLSESAVYPLIVILSCAGCFMVGMGAHAVMYYKDLRISPQHKRETLQTWGTEKTPSVTSVISEGPAFHRSAFKSIHGKEGLGVDHEEWKKQKQAYLES
jgi:hypothetical protein